MLIYCIELPAQVDLPVQVVMVLRGLDLCTLARGHCGGVSAGTKSPGSPADAGGTVPQQVPNQAQ